MWSMLAVAFHHIAVADSMSHCPAPSAVVLWLVLMCFVHHHPKWLYFAVMLARPTAAIPFLILRCVAVSYGAVSSASIQWTIYSGIVKSVVIHRQRVWTINSFATDQELSMHCQRIGVEMLRLVSIDCNQVRYHLKWHWIFFIILLKMHFINCIKHTYFSD